MFTSICLINFNINSFNKLKGRWNLVLYYITVDKSCKNNIRTFKRIFKKHREKKYFFNIRPGFFFFFFSSVHLKLYQILAVRSIYYPNLTPFNNASDLNLDKAISDISSEIKWKRPGVYKQLRFKLISVKWVERENINIEIYFYEEILPIIRNKASLFIEIKERCFSFAAFVYVFLVWKILSHAFAIFQKAISLSTFNCINLCELKNY